MLGEEYLVLGAKGYDFKNDEGARMQGMNISYCDLSFRDDKELEKGNLPMKVACIGQVFNQLDVLPGYYNLDFRQRPDGKGKAVLTVVNATFIREFKISAK